MSDLYDKQHDAEIVRLNDRITELEASLADSNEALQVLGLKLAHAEGHSANTVGGPTPVAAPACEQLADNEDAVYAVAYKLCLQDGADEDSAHTLIWEGHPPEPWGEVWMRYEFQARELLKALDERRALMANHQATFQSSHECVSRVSNSDSQMNKQDDTRTTGESASKSDGRMKGIEMREVFEKLMLEKHLVADLSMDGDDYYDATALVGWECFQAGAAYGSNQELTDILKLLDTAPGLPLDSCKPEELQAWTTAIKSVLVHIGAALK